MKPRTYTYSGKLGHGRLHVKGHRDTTAMYRYLTRLQGNGARIYVGPLKPGTYAFCGGEWRNVKSLDPVLLAHV